MKRCFHIITGLFFSITTYGQIKGSTVQKQVFALTEVMYHDVVNPPAAARFYSYSLLAGYEILCQLDTGLNCFQKKIKRISCFSN